MPTNWRDFEEMVAGIERTLAPKGAVVRSPDHIPDLLTGELREVDASIRLDVGSANVLITVECRKRRPVQDITWIEQLASKRDNIGAAKTIAVSASGFSERAIEYAKRAGIELRTLEDRIGEEIVQQFLSGFKMSFLVSEYSTRTIAFVLEDGAPLPPSELGDDLMTALRTEGVAAVVASEVATGRGLTIDAIVGRVIDKTNVPLGGDPAPREVHVEFRPGTFTVSTRQGPRFLKQLDVVAEFNNRVVPAPATRFYEYGAPDKPIRRVIEAIAHLSEQEGIRLLADIESPALDRAVPPDTAVVAPAKRKGRGK